MRNKVTITVYGNRTEHRYDLSGRWEICSHCEGGGTTTRHIECDGGGFTGEEWAEACHDDEDFAEKYFGGFYDRPCEFCRGSGKVLVVDRDRVHNRWMLKILAEYDRQCRDNDEIDAMQEAERRMGA